MAWCLFGSEALPEASLAYCQFDPLEQTSIFIEENVVDDIIDLEYDSHFVQASMYQSSLLCVLC